MTNDEMKKSVNFHYALPLLTSCRASALPIPEFPPVIMTTKPSNRVVQRQIPPAKYRL